MGVMTLKKASLLLLILASLHSISLAVGNRKLMTEISEQEITAEDSLEIVLEQEDAVIVHPRILMVKTNDYGRYNPSPSLSKPPFKLIPN
ncbi:protein CASPARIAN STRIP INTEGRITY FACTOR 2-like [Typha angustifolia]|uniref:protein CASPARIAN STRIP INTEGRITY FACTOR 2-like n=1 Tax=Typha angustifolia TaxID=59011 RepID=UPI003C2F2213